VQPRTWSMIHWRAASTSVLPPPKSWAGPARTGLTSAALPVRYRVTFACAGSVETVSSTTRNSRTDFLILILLYPEECAEERRARRGSSAACVACRDQLLLAEE